MQLSRKALWIAALVAAYTIFVPLVRTFMHLEVGYNEGWNLYNARTVLNHRQLYVERYGWHTDNYPALSFYISAWLSHVTGDLLYTGRVLSLLGLFASATLLGAMVYHLTRSRPAATFTALLAVSILCATAPGYVGQYDPQLLATAFFLGALYIYLRYRTVPLALAGSAFLFVVGGNIKHNLIDIPLAVAIDLAIARRWKGLALFLSTLLTTGTLSLYLNTHIAGPAFLTNLLAGRGYSLAHAFENFIGSIGPLIPPFALAIYAAWKSRNDSARRITTIWLASAVTLNTFFAGGAGVADNAFFDTLFAIALLSGIFVAPSFTQLYGKKDELSSPAQPQLLIPALAVFPLLALFINNETSLPLRDLRRLQQQQTTYEQSLAFLKTHHGPAICESLLLCAEAGKPYLYDPFNATRFIELGKLNPEPLLALLQEHEFAMTQLNKPIPETERDTDANRFTPQVLQSIDRNYHPVFERPGSVILLPNQ